jgi:hypothetical protein
MKKEEIWKEERRDLTGNHSSGSDTGSHGRRERRAEENGARREDD